MRMIDADALKDNMFSYAPPEMSWDRDDIEHKVDEMPTIEPKRGKWIEDDYIIVCSECREPAMQRVFYSLTYHTTDIKMVKTPYCPHCGALMMEGDGTDEVD